MDTETGLMWASGNNGKDIKDWAEQSGFIAFRALPVRNGR